jgi:hypothetical protein
LNGNKILIFYLNVKINIFLFSLKTTTKRGMQDVFLFHKNVSACPAGTFHRTGEKLDFSGGKRFKTMIPKTVNEEKLGEGIRVRVTELEKKLLLQRNKKRGLFNFE